MPTKPYTNWSFDCSCCSMESTWCDPSHPQCCCLSHPCLPLNGLIWFLVMTPFPFWKATVCLYACAWMSSVKTPCLCVCVFWVSEWVREWESAVLTSRKPSSDAVAGHCKDCLDTAGWFWLIDTCDTQAPTNFHPHTRARVRACVCACVCVRNVQVLKESSLQFSSNPAVDRHLAATTESVSVYVCCVLCVIVS